MSEAPLASLEDCFGDIHDPRVQGRCSYSLLEIITIAICAVVAGADTWTEIETFGKSKEAWLRQFLPLENGIPARAARLWLVLALAHLWTMSVGGEAEGDDLALPDSVLVPIFPATTTPRVLSCLNRGWIRIIVALITHRPLPMGRFWPALPFNRSMLDLLMPGGHFVPLKTYP